MTTTRVASAAQDEHANERHRELEWQMAAADLPAVRRWLSDHSVVDNLLIETRPSLELCDTYLDTVDWRIHRAGLALRVRSAAGKAQATLKAVYSTQAEVADRLELSETLPNARHETLLESPGPVGKRVHAVVGEHALRELFEVRTTRQRFAVLSQDRTSDLGEIALDETVISTPHGEPQASVRRVEVEALTTTPKPLENVVNTLRTQCALEPVAESKFALGLKSLGLAPPAPPTVTPANVDASMRMGDVALANLRRHASAWLAHEPGARLGDDPEALHDLRVAARRMDVVLAMFRPYLPAALTRARPRLKRLLASFGNVRDLDVALAELGEFATDLPLSERAPLEPLQRQLRSERERARGQMLAALDSAGTQRWMEKLMRDVAHPPSSRKPDSDAAAVAVAPDLIRDRYRKVRKAAKRLTADSSLEEYHRVRGRGKKLRYAIESVAAVYGRPAEELLRALRRFQDKLGTQQDAHVAQSRLLALAKDPPEGFTPQTVFMMGRLAERHGTAGTRARERVPKAFGKLRGRRWKRLCAKLEEMSAPPPQTTRPAESSVAEPAIPQSSENAH
jgi:triphosphatase